MAFLLAFLVAPCTRALEVPIHVTWTDDPATTATVSWQRNEPGRGTVAFGTNTLYGSSLSDPGGTRNHSLTVRGLQPQTRYFYKATSTDGYQAEGTFLTAPARAADSTFHFAVHGDLQGGLSADWAATVVDAILADDPDFVVHVGDLAVEDVEPGFSSWTAFFNIAREELARYAFQPIPGNHDWPGNPNAYWWQVLNLPAHFGPANPYSYNVGNTHFVALNSEVDLPGQALWLARDLQAAANDTNTVWIIPCVHRPPYSYGERLGDEDVRDAFSPLFAQYGVDIVFSGHSHNYQRMVPIRDVRYVVTGGGGGRLYTSDFTPGAHVAASTCYHFVSAQVTGSVMNYRAIRSDGQVIDQEVFTHAGRFVRVEPAFPRRGETARIFYDATRGPLAGADPVHVHLGIDTFASPELDQPMTFNPLNQRWEFAFTVPTNATNRIAFAFHNAEASVWHNNHAYNWQALLDRVSFTPEPLQAGSAVTLRYEADMSSLGAATQIIARMDFDPDLPGADLSLTLTNVAGATWECVLPLPEHARRLDLSFSDGVTTDTDFGRSWRRPVLGATAAPPAVALPLVVPATPFLSTHPVPQNHPGDNFDFDLSGTSLRSHRERRGFGRLGDIYFNADADYLYVGGTDADLGGSNNVFLLFLGMNTLTDDAENLWHKSSLPNALNLLHNIGFTEPMDIGLVLGSEFGDGTHYTNFTYAGYNFGQGIFYLGTNSATFAVVPGSRLSQFDGAGTTPCLTEDDDGDERTTRWEAAIPWSSLNAPQGVRSLTHLHVAGVIASDATQGNDRYLSAHFVGTRGLHGFDAYGQIGYNFLTIRPEPVPLGHGDYWNDGIPNEWRHRRLGGVRGPGAAEDSDGDAETNLREYIADTDPLDEASRFRAGLGPWVPGTVTVTWPYAAGRVYTVHRTTNWALPFAPYATELRTNAFLAPLLPAAFYAVEVELEP